MSSLLAARLGALSMFVSVACGAFGAHALKRRLDVELLAVWETAARYQAYHALALLLLAALWDRLAPRQAAAAGWLLAAGTVLFSGSLYLLALTGARKLGAITPLGGLAWLAAWLAFAAAASRR